MKLASPVSVEPKEPRWICDHRVLNEYFKLVSPPMHYDDLNSFRKELLKGESLFTVDLAAGYNHMPVALQILVPTGGGARGGPTRLLVRL